MSDVSARILARMSVSVSVSWNSSLNVERVLNRRLVVIDPVCVMWLIVPQHVCCGEVLNKR